MKYNILTHEEFVRIHNNGKVYVQRYSKIIESFVYLRTDTHYTIKTNDVVAVKKSDNDYAMLFFMDRDCVIELISRHDQEKDIYDLSENKGLTYKQAIEIAAL